MSALFQNILGFLLLYKYATLFIVCFFSSLGIPLPAGSSTIASAAFASQGYLNIFAVMFSSVIGNILGDVVMYTFSKKYGKKVLYWFHLGKVVESRALKNIEEVENKYSALTIIASRFQDQATTILNVLAGLGNIKFKRFITYAIIGDILQIAFYSSIGYFFAGNWESFYKVTGIFSWLIVLVVVIISAFLTNKYTKKKFLN